MRQKIIMSQLRGVKSSQGPTGVPSTNTSEVLTKGIPWITSLVQVVHT